MTLPTEVNLLLAGNQGGYQISRSVRTRSSATAYFNRTFPVAGNRQIWTWSAWYKRGAFGIGQTIFSGGSSTDRLVINFAGTDQIIVSNLVASVATTIRTTTQLFRDPAAWYHVVVAVDTTQPTASNRIYVAVNGVQITSFATSSDFTLNYNTYINNNVTHTINVAVGTLVNYVDGYTTEINFIDGQALPAASFGEFNAITGVWQPKKYAGTYGTNGFYLPFSNNVTSDNLVTYSELIGGTTWTNNANVTASTNSIVAPNGSTTASTLTSTGADGFSYGITGAVASGNTFTFSVWLKAPSTTNINLFIGRNGLSNYEIFPITVTTAWTRFTATFVTSGTTIAYLIGGGNSFTTGEVIHAWGAQINGGDTVQQYLKTTTTAVSAIPAFGQDFSLGDASYNTWTSNNISLTAGITYDSMIDVPTPYDDGGNGRGNYCVWNPLDKQSTNITVSNGNLTSSMGLVAESIRATMGMSSGKWYWENTITVTGGLSIGILNAAASLAGHVGQNANGWAYWYDGRKVNNNTFVAYGAAYATGDVVGVTFDADARELIFYKNGVSQGVAYTGIAANTYFPAMGNGGSTVNVNFGQRPFTYTPPSGFKALNTQNLPASTIDNGAAYMAATLYTGNGATQSINNAVNGVSFQPDFVWLKSRSTIDGNNLFDAVRGATKRIVANSTNAEDTTSGVTAFNSNGFSLGSTTSNVNASTYVGWQWKAGGAAVTNTAGSISSQVSANVSAGFSVVTYTGNGVTAATVGHGLNAIPAMVIIKERGTAGTNWMVKHQSLASSNNLFLQGTNATTNITTAVGGGGIANLSSSTTFNFLAGTSNTDNVNRNTGTFVAYCFAEVAGYSKFGSYTGNGSADGPFVFTNFRPRFVMIKRTNSTSNWRIVDTARDPYNVAQYALWANDSSAEGSGASHYIDILSNGFKLRNTALETNASGGTYIFMAFAENPFKNALAR